MISEIWKKIRVTQDQPVRLFDENVMQRALWLELVVLPSDYELADPSHEKQWDRIQYGTDGMLIKPLINTLSSDLVPFVNDKFTYNIGQYYAQVYASTTLTTDTLPYLGMVGLGVY